MKSIIEIKVEIKSHNVYGLKEWLNKHSNLISFNIQEGECDQIVENVISQLKERSTIGVDKYGRTLEQNNDDDFLQHLKEELMDAALYCEKLQQLKIK